MNLSTERYFLRWREVLDERLTATVESLSAVRGVVAVVVAGSLGRGEAWPLSDIDIVPIYAAGEAAEAADEGGAGREVSAWAKELEAAWEAEGVRTDVDVGNIWFTDRESREAVAWTPAQTVPRLADFRWYHGIDKPYGGRVAWDPTGVAGGFLEWLNGIRFSPEIVSAILLRVGGEFAQLIDHAALDLQRGDDDKAGIALHHAGYLMMAHLMETFGLRCSSFARFGTRFDRAMAERGRTETARSIMAVMLLGSDDVERRFDDAPDHLQQRHRLSLAARRVTGEDVTALQDRRDVLLAFTTFAFRRGIPPLGRWTGVGCDRGTLVSRLEIARGLRSAILA